MNAPVCVAKGVDLIALKIREVAQRARGAGGREPAARARPARQRSRSMTKIPAEHYKAVAEIIGYVMKLRRATARA